MENIGSIGFFQNKCGMSDEEYIYKTEEFMIIFNVETIVLLTLRDVSERKAFAYVSM